MKKVRFVQNEAEDVVSFEYNGQKVEVKPFMNSGEQSLLIENYLATYFYSKDNPVSGLKYDHLSAEYGMVLSVIDMFTSILVVENDSLLIDPSRIYNTELWREITSKIQNYSDFRMNLLSAVEDKRKELELELSFGFVVSSLVKRLEELLINSNEVFSNPELVNKMTEDFKSALDQFKETPIGKLVEEAQK